MHMNGIVTVDKSSLRSNAAEKHYYDGMTSEFKRDGVRAVIGVIFFLISETHAQGSAMYIPVPPISAR